MCCLQYIFLIIFGVAIVLLFMQCPRESYWGGAYPDPALAPFIPEYPTFDHIRSNIWTRNNLDSDKDLSDPYDTYDTYDTYRTAPILPVYDQIYFDG